MGFVYPQVSWGRYAAIPAFSSGLFPQIDQFLHISVRDGGSGDGGSGDGGSGDGGSGDGGSGDGGRRRATGSSPQKKIKFEVGQMVNISWGNKLKSQKYVIVKNARI
jgi:hypothetical protein